MLVSGFRAFTREAALNTNIVSSFSYTMIETSNSSRAQALRRKVRADRDSPTPRRVASRLFPSIPEILMRSVSNDAANLCDVPTVARVRLLRVMFAITLGSIPVI